VARFQAPKGTQDVLPPASARWAALIALFAERARRAGYGLVVSPVFEDAAVFERVGESTDVVGKEMYEFEDKGGRRLALRPEGTASLVRAFVEHRPKTPFKGWYVAPHFRYERPQAGRYRQHHQLGVEAIGSADPELDVEVITLAASVLDDLGLGRVTLHLNSLGDDTCRPDFLRRLREHLASRTLCDEHAPSWQRNPLRVLDCKRDACRAATDDAPSTVSALCDPCRVHFEAVQAGLARHGLEHVLDPRLVRGLDYYTRTTFEFAAGALETAQNGIGGGGRYDKLVEALGGPPTPGIGFGIGIERLLLACDAEGVFPAPAAVVDVWVVDATDDARAIEVVHELRRAGVATDRAFDAKSVSAQFKSADRSGARLAVVVGPSEIATGKITVRDLTSGEQELIDRGELVAHVKGRLAR
jgi:histidyl-tRNA synthetase